jgi:hypothetical protein
VSVEVLDCAHRWIANSGRGGSPDWRRWNRSIVMHVACSGCGARTWFTPEQWNRLPRADETRQMRRKRERERDAAKAARTPTQQR